MTKRLVVIDGKSVFYRGYYAMPGLANRVGTPTGGVYGFAVLALQILKQFTPDYVIVAWDKSKTNVRSRKKLYPQYKANRKPMPEEMRAQIPYIRRLLEGFSWPLLEVDDYEADDIMGTLAKMAEKRGIETILITSDQDVLQLVDGLVKVCLLKKGLTNIKEYDAKSIKAEFGFSKEQFDDYKALKGDASDNIPGVPGVGEKTAKDLVLKYTNLEGIYKHLDDIKGALRTKLEQGKESAYLSRQLVHIMCDAPVELDLKAADASEANPESLRDLFKELEFKRLQSELPEQMVAQAGLFDPTPQAIPELSINELASLKDLPTAAKYVMHALAEVDPKTQLPKISQLIISARPGQAYSLEVGEWDSKALRNAELIGYDLKHYLKSGLKLECKSLFDVAIAGFILNPLARQLTIEELAAKELDMEFSKNMDPGDRLSLAIAALWQLYERYQDKLKAEPKLKKVADELDMPLVPVLARMEQAGIELDTDYLKKMSQNFAGQIDKVVAQIHKEAGQEFNISSPQQLQLILFEKLQLPTMGIKKTQTGYSTNATELEKLRSLHPIIDLITEYRELTKLKSTYIDALPKLVDARSRLHTNFSQTVAPTGRLSSLNPNLQNIPVRTELGRDIRTAFVAGRGKVLISADYSQFELRLAAVLANDQNMIHAFNKGIDIHVMTAAELYDVEVGEVTKEQRYSAKTVNFGVLYGMSPHGLSVATGMTRDQAAGFIKRYFDLRKDLLAYIEKLKVQARDQGYVETLFGRRRPTPDVKSPNFVLRAAAERAAVNMPIQGTEADLMKLAMIKIDEQLDDDCKMLLQIHDSILVEAPKAKSEQVSKLLKDIMENVYRLPVNLDVDVTMGRTWGEL